MGVPLLLGPLHGNLMWLDLGWSTDQPNQTKSNQTKRNQTNKTYHPHQTNQTIPISHFLPPFLTGDGSRLSQIVEWLGNEDYLIVLDECHKVGQWSWQCCLSSSAACPAADQVALLLHRPALKC